MILDIRDAEQTANAFVAKIVKEDYVIILLGWEKRRLVYNGLLIAVTVTLCAQLNLWGRLGREFFELNLLVLALVANVLYLLGPAMECFLTHRGRDCFWIRRGMFWGGTLLSMAMAAYLLYSFAFPLETRLFN